MQEIEHSTSKDPQILPARIGEVLGIIYKLSTEHPSSQIGFSKILPTDPEIEGEIRGAISILHTLGIIAVEDEDSVHITSKYARFALGSLIHFLINSIPISVNADSDDDDREYMTTLTGAMERIRKLKLGGDPLHSRTIMNVIISGTQIRNWRERSVYLHVYHPKWNAYHLVGLGKKNPNRELDEVAERAMDIKLGLNSPQYEFSPSIRVDDIDYIDVSGSHGALTKYKIHARVVRKISADIDAHLKYRVKNRIDGTNDLTYRWFTQEEIANCVSENNEIIMRSTPLVMNALEGVKLENVAKKISFSYQRKYWWTGLSNRINRRKALIYFAIIILLIIGFVIAPMIINPLLESSNFTERSSLILQTIEVVLGLAALIVAIVGIRDST